MSSPAARPLRIGFIVESGTDVRLVEGLSERAALTVVARAVPGGREISQPTETAVTVVVGPSSFARFALFVHRWVLAHRGELDVLLVQGYGPAALCANVAARLRGLRGVMLVCSPVEAYYECRRMDPGSRPYRRREALVIRIAARANALVGCRYAVLSSYLASVVRRHGARAAIDVVPVYGVDTQRFAPSMETRTEVRRRLGLPSGPSLVFFSSRMAPEKDPDVLLAAVAQLRGEGRDVRILHLSGGYREFQARAAQRGLGEAVIAADAVSPLDDLASWYRACDVCVQASREEGLGFSPLESLACGVPVVATRIGGLCDTIVDGDTGWTYPRGDAAALAGAIRDVLDRPVEGARRAARGRELVCCSYRRELVFDRLVDLLRQCAQAGGGTC